MRVFSFLVFSFMTSFLVVWPVTAIAQPTVAVVGDSMADGYCRGLKRVLKGGPAEVICWTRPSSGLTRVDFYDWNGALASKLATQRVDIAVVSLGANDAQRMVVGDKVASFGDANWQQTYASRVDQIVQRLTAQGARVTWVGLPNVRSGQFSRKLDLINQIYRARVPRQGGKFYSMWTAASDGSGAYTARLKDATGRLRPARQKDGIHFNSFGEVAVSCGLAKVILPARVVSC